MKRLSKTQRAAIREHIQYEEASVREVGPSNATTELSDALRAALEVLDSLTEALRDREARLKRADWLLRENYAREHVATVLDLRQPFKPEGET